MRIVARVASWLQNIEFTASESSNQPAMAFVSSSSDAEFRSSTPDQYHERNLFAAVGLEKGYSHSEDSSESSESSNYSPGKEQAMIDSLYPVQEIPRGSPELGLLTTPVLRYKTTEELVAREPGEQSASDDSYIYDPPVSPRSPSPHPRELEIPETPPFTSEIDSDWNENGCPWESASDSTEEPETPVSGRTARSRRRPNWYHPHTATAKGWIERQTEWPKMMEDYKAWDDQTLLALQIAWLKGFMNGDNDEHCESRYFKEGERKAFGIITACLERGVDWLKVAAGYDVLDKCCLRDWAVAGRKALVRKGKVRTLIPYENGRPGTFEMSAKELWVRLEQYAKRWGNDPLVAARLEAMAESISPRTIVVMPNVPATVPPGPSAAVPGPSATAAATSAQTPVTHLSAAGPAFAPSSSAPGPSGPVINPPSVSNFLALTPDPVEVYEQWRRFFSSNFLDNGGNVRSFSESLDIQAADVTIFGERFALPQWAKKMQFLHGLPDHFAEAKADFIRQCGPRLLLDDPEYDASGHLVDDKPEAVTWKSLVDEMGHKEEVLVGEKMSALETELQRQEEARRAEEQLRQEAARRQESAKNQRRDERMRIALGPNFQDWKKGTLDSSTNAAAAATSKAPPLLKEIVPSPPNEPNAPLRTLFYQFASRRKCADPRKDATPARSAMKRPSPPTVTSSARLYKGKFKKAERLTPATSTEPTQSSASATQADDQPDASKGKTKLELSCAPVKKSDPAGTSTGNGTKAAQPSDSGTKTKSRIGSDVNKLASIGAAGEKSKQDLPNTPVRQTSKPNVSCPSGVTVKPTSSSEQGSNINPSAESKANKLDPPNAADGTTTKQTLPSTRVRKPTKHVLPRTSSDSGNTTKTSSKEVVALKPSIYSNSQAKKPKLPTAARKTIIDPARINVGPATLPEYCNTCQTTGHADRTRHCPKFDPFAGRIIGNENRRGPVLRKSEQERLLKEQEEVAEMERKEKAKQEKRAARAERKQREKLERERLEKERLDKEHLDNKKREGEDSKERTHAKNDEAGVLTVATSVAAEGKDRKKKTARAIKVELKQSSAPRDTEVNIVGIKVESEDQDEKIELEMDEHASRQQSEAAATPVISDISTASAGTKRKIEEVEEVEAEAPDVDKAERKRRKKEKRQRKRDAKLEKRKLLDAAGK